MIHIRNLSKSDSGQVSVLIGQLTKDIVEPDNLSARIEALVDQAASRFLVAEQDGAVAGFAGLVWYDIPW